MAAEESWLELPAGRCHYTDDGTGTAVVLVHGWSYSTATWAGVVPILVSAGHRVVTYDVRGHGRTPLGEAPVTMPDLVEDLSGLIDALGLGTPVVAGHSLGGMVGLGLAVHHPDRLGALGLVDTAAAARPADVELDQMLADHLRTGADNEYWWGLLEPMLYSPTYVRDSAPTVAAARDRFLAADLRALHTVFHALATRDDLTPRLGEVRVPTAVVVGEADALWTPADHARLADAIPGATLAVAPGAGHLTPEEAPDFVARELLALADRASAAFS